jgi:transcriptional regulator with XRE-family HTH domain
MSKATDPRDEGRTRWGIVNVEPSSRDGVGFYDGCDAAGNDFGGVATDLPCYPVSPAGLVLRELRTATGTNLRDGAVMLGISVVDLSGLERGSRTLSDPKTWRILAGRFGRRSDVIAMRLRRLRELIPIVGDPKVRERLEGRATNLERRLVGLTRDAASEPANQGDEPESS